MSSFFKFERGPCDSILRDYIYIFFLMKRKIMSDLRCLYIWTERGDHKTWRYDLTGPLRFSPFTLHSFLLGERNYGIGWKSHCPGPTQDPLRRPRPPRMEGPQDPKRTGPETGRDGQMGSLEMTGSTNVHGYDRPVTSPHVGEVGDLRLTTKTLADNQRSVFAVDPITMSE